MLFVQYLDPSTTKFVLHAHVQLQLRFLSNAIIGLNVVFNLDLFIFYRLGLYHIFPPVYMIRSSYIDS